MAAILLALAAGVSWGVSDFLGGLNSRSLALAVVMLISQAVGLALLLPIALLHGWPQLDPPTVGFAIAGSVSGLAGIAGLYRGMAVGSISVVAPISATGAVLPVFFGLIRGEHASPLQSLGMVLALVGVVLAARAAGEPQPPLATTWPEPANGGLNTAGRINTAGSRISGGVGFAVLAALGFGGFFVLLHEASTHDVLWAAVIQRLTGVCVMLAVVLARRLSLAVDRRRSGALLAIGVLDTGANVLYAYASNLGLVSLAAVLASLFPVVTVLLARVVLRERLTASQGTGVVCALAGVACISLQ